jgi:hypothetical protein
MQKIKIYKTKPSKGSGWAATDPARSAEQAKEMVRTGYQGADAIVVKTGTRGDVFPYTIYTRDRSESDYRIKIQHKFGF